MSERINALREIQFKDIRWIVQKDLWEIFKEKLKLLAETVV